MPKMDAEKLLAAYEVERLIYEFAAELDHDAHNITDLYTEDADFIVAGNTLSGHAAIAKFYTDRNERVRTQQKDGARTGRHTFLNVRVDVHDSDTATAYFINVNYTGEGKAPIMDLVGPNMVSDCRMKFRRQADGWR